MGEVIQAVLIALTAALLKHVAGKLLPPVTSKFASIKGVKKDLSYLQNIHGEIASRLSKVSDTELYGQVTKLAQDIDDLLREVHEEAKKNKKDSNGEHAISDGFSSTPKSLLFRCKVAHKVKALRVTFSAIVKQKGEVNTVLPNMPPELVGGTKMAGKDQEKDNVTCETLGSDEGEDGWMIVTEDLSHQSSPGDHKIKAIDITFAAIVKQKGDVNTARANFPSDLVGRSMAAAVPSLLANADETNVQGKDQEKDNVSCETSESSDEGQDGWMIVTEDLCHQSSPRDHKIEAIDVTFAAIVKQKGDVNTARANFPSDLVGRSMAAAVPSLLADADKTNVQGKDQEKDNVSCKTSESSDEGQDGWMIVTEDLSHQSRLGDHKIKAIDVTFAAIVKQKGDVNTARANFPSDLVGRSMAAAVPSLLADADETNVQGKDQEKDNVSCETSE